jgi:hypothetical protein
LLLGTPVEEIGRIKRDAKEIRGYETELSGADTDNTDDGTIEGGNYPALPELLAEEDGAQDCQNAGEIIESNHVEHIEHVGLMSRCRSLFKQSTGALRVPVLLLTAVISAPGQ